MSESGLAAVHAAAGAISTTEHEAALARARAEGHAAGRTEGEATGRAAGLAEGATAERTRILGIEANALPGHEALVATMKADPAVTPDIAAGRILGAERKLRGDAAQAIVDVERATGGLKPANLPPAAPTAASTPEGWKAEFATSAELQAEFAGDAEAYVGFKSAEAAGKVRRLTAKSA